MRKVPSLKLFNASLYRRSRAPRLYNRSATALRISASPAEEPERHTVPLRLSYACVVAAAFFFLRHSWRDDCILVKVPPPAVT